LAGNVQAMKEIADRIDGRPAQAVTVGGDPEKPVEHRMTVEFVSAGKAE
jgi:hypothetical protein